MICYFGAKIVASPQQEEIFFPNDTVFFPNIMDTRGYETNLLADFPDIFYTFAPCLGEKWRDLGGFCG
jgi:hypothetical protein